MTATLLGASDLGTIEDPRIRHDEWASQTERESEKKLTALVARNSSSLFPT